VNIQRTYLDLGMPFNYSIPTVGGGNNGSSYYLVGPTLGSTETNQVKWTGSEPAVDNPPSFGEISGKIQNLSKSVLTLNIYRSLDNGISDAYASNAVTFRVGGAGVTSLTLQPYAQGTFVIEYAARGGAVALGPIVLLSKPYLQFKITSNTVAKIGLAYWEGLMEVRPMVGSL